MLDPGNGALLKSVDLVGAVLVVTNDDGAPLRIKIAGVRPHPRVPDILLHDFRIESAPGIWTPLCSPDALGLRMGFPIPGGWDEQNRFIANEDRLFVTCTSGAQGKCVVFGYDPWKLGPNGESLIPIYEACQRMVRAAYCNNQGTTKDGTEIDYFDSLGIARDETTGDPAFAFEAGWEPQGAVCVAHTRRPEVLSMAALLAACPRLAIPPVCSEATAVRAGAILFNRSRPVPQNR